MPLRITVDGDQFFSTDLTVDECIAIEDEYKIGWLELVSTPFRSAKHSKAVFVALASRKLGREKALEVVGAMTFRQLDEAVELVEDDDRPVQHANGIPVVDPKATSGG